MAKGILRAGELTIEITGENLIVAKGENDLTIQAPTGHKIVIGSDTLVQGTGAFNFAGGFIIHGVSADPVSPVPGQMWFRTDL